MFQTDAPKHVLIMIHLHRGLTSSTNERWQLNFQCGWKQVSIDTVEPTDLAVVDVLGGSVVELFEKVCPHVKKSKIKNLSFSFFCYFRGYSLSKNPSFRRLTGHLLASNTQNLLKHHLNVSYQFNIAFIYVNQFECSRYYRLKKPHQGFKFADFGI